MSNNGAAHDCWNQKRVLVTGGLGFIGSNLAARLVSLGADVTIVDSLVPGCGGDPGNAPAGAQVIRCDIAAPEDFRASIANADLIFNLAGEISHIGSMREPERDLRINTISHLRFLEACRLWKHGVRIVYAGTRQVFGRPRYLPVDAGHPLQPVDYNGVHKLAASLYHVMLSNLGDLDAVVLHLSNVYGPRMTLSAPGKGVLQAFFGRAIQGESIELFGSGLQRRDPVFVEDVVDAFLAAAIVQDPGSRVFNIGGPEALSLLEIAHVLVGEHRVAVAPFPPDRARIDIGDYCTDLTPVRQALGWSPGIRFADGAARTIESYAAVRG